MTHQLEGCQSQLPFSNQEKVFKVLTIFAEYWNVDTEGRSMPTNIFLVAGILIMFALPSFKAPCIKNYIIRPWKIS